MEKSQLSAIHHQPLSSLSQLSACPASPCRCQPILSTPCPAVSNSANHVSCQLILPTRRLSSLLCQPASCQPALPASQLSGLPSQPVICQPGLLAPVGCPASPAPTPVSCQPTLPTPVSCQPTLLTPVSCQPTLPTPVSCQPTLPTPVSCQPTLPTPVSCQPTLPTPVSCQPTLPTPVSCQPILSTPVTPCYLLSPTVTPRHLTPLYTLYLSLTVTHRHYGSYLSSSVTYRHSPSLSVTLCHVGRSGEVGRWGVRKGQEIRGEEVRIMGVSVGGE
ncbi:Keratin-associated protein 12-2-like 2, partial [Homarus americanus]